MIPVMLLFTLVDGFFFSKDTGIIFTINSDTPIHLSLSIDIQNRSCYHELNLQKRSLIEISGRKPGHLSSISQLAVKIKIL